MMAILYLVSGLKYMNEEQIETWKKKFNWKGIDVDAPVSREGIIKWNKNNHN